MKIVFLTNSYSRTAVPYLKELMASNHDIAGIFLLRRGNLDKRTLRNIFKKIKKTGLKHVLVRFVEVIRIKLSFSLSKMFKNMRKENICFYDSVEKLLVYNPCSHFRVNDLADTEVIKQIEELNPDLIFVCTLSQILKNPLLNIPKYGCVNIHTGLLPKYRGPASNFWVLHNEEAKTGITFHYLTEGVDSGDIIRQEELKIYPEDTEESLDVRLSELGAGLITGVIKDIEQGTVKRGKQDETQATYFPQPRADLREQLKRKQRRNSQIPGGIKKMRKVPIAAYPITISNLCSGWSFLTEKNWEEKLESEFKKYFNTKYVYFMNSGTSACFKSLEVLKQNNNKQEVILPAYTAASLVHAVQKAGLKPVLVDISLDNFNMDTKNLASIISKNAMAIIAVHMFGVLMPDINNLKRDYRDVFIIEDSCQSFGSKIDGKKTAEEADISFFSLNRGKNIPTYGGGIIVTNKDEIGNRLSAETRALRDISPMEKISIMFKLLILSIVVKPWIYGLLHPLLSFFKAGLPNPDFKTTKYSAYQAGVVLSLLKTIDELSRKRYEHGMRLVAGLQGGGDIRLPQIPDNIQPAFNHFPVVFGDLNRMARVEKKLWQQGIGTSRMYPAPLHYVFDLGYKKDDFPNACYLARHLLTLPVHPLLKDEDIEKIITTIRRS